jgi:trimeric autotransporter adhesin
LTTTDTFAVDPNFRVGYAETWQLAVQRDLPGALQLTATYLGIKGTRGVQQFLPNTYPIGATSPCPGCPSGFVYQTSGGDSTRQSGQIQLRRRLRNGFTASLLYTFSKSIDDDALLGGLGHVTASAQGQSSTDSTSSEAPTESAATPTPAIAQNWLNLHAERSLSSFDQRHLLNVQVQYTSGEGLGGRTLMTGWQGRLFKGWTSLTKIVAGSGLPETPVYSAAVPGTGFTGTIRPDPTGSPVYRSGAGPHLNAAAYSAPLPGQWGTAGRNSITGPDQFSLDTRLLARSVRAHASIWTPVSMPPTCSTTLSSPAGTRPSTARNSAFRLPPTQCAASKSRCA